MARKTTKLNYDLANEGKVLLDPLPSKGDIISIMVRDCESIGQDTIVYIKTGPNKEKVERTRVFNPELGAYEDLHLLIPSGATTAQKRFKDLGKQEYFSLEYEGTGETGIIGEVIVTY